MTIRFLEAARDDLREAERYYEGQLPSLGREFLEEVRATVERIESFPNAWHPLSANTRRCLTHRFPYGVIYQIREDQILVVAVAHLHRGPEHWKNRLASS